MKKVMIIVLGLSILLGGCSADTASPKKEVMKVESIVPEPYIVMEKNLKEQNLDTTLDFANLTIKDFPDTEYAYNAHIIRTLILSGNLHTYDKLLQCTYDGVQNMSAFVKTGDDLIIKDYITKLLNLEKPMEILLDESFNYILANYDPNKKYAKINFPISDIKSINDSEYVGFNWFSDIGYPLPKQSDFDSCIKNIPPKAFYVYMNAVKTSEDIDYSKYFYYMSFKTGNTELRRKLLNKVMDLTENDKYNELRIKAEKVIID